MNKLLFKLSAAVLFLSGALNLLTELLFLLSINNDILLKSANFIGAALALWGMLGLYILKSNELKRLGLVLFSVYSLGLVGIVGFLFADAFVFTQLDTSTVTNLTNGVTGQAVFASIILYVLGLVSFGIYSSAKKVYPRIPLLLYSFGALITPFAMLLPYVIVSIVELTASCCVVYLGWWLWIETRKINVK